MINRENVEYCIELMRNAKNLDMRSWQQCSDGGYGLVLSIEQRATTVKDLHKCGNSACFAGYVAISEKFKADGGFAMTTLSPCIADGNGGRAGGHRAISLWLGIDEKFAYDMVHGDVSHLTEHSSFYNKSWSAVAPEDVIEKLQMILDGKVLARSGNFRCYH